MSWIERLIKVVYSPREVFTYLSEKPDWLVPFIILLVVSFVAVFLIYEPIIRPEQVRRIEENPNISPEQREQIMESFGGSRGKAFVLAGGLIWVVIGLFATSGILYGVFTLMGGEGRFKKVLSVCSYSLMIQVLSDIVKIPLILGKGSGEVYTSAVLLAPGLSSEVPLFRLLNNFDVFTLWRLWVMIIGMAVMYKFSPKKAAAGVLPLWAVWVVLTIFLPGLTPGG